MKTNLLIGLTAIVLAACATPSVSHAEKATAPVEITYDVPKNVQTGDVVSATLHISPTTSLTGLSVTVAPYKGVDLLSSTGPFTFGALDPGAMQSIPVQVRLTDPELGYLSVVATTESAVGRSNRAITVPFGAVGPATKQDLQSGMMSVTPEGERLIEMPTQPTIH